MFDFLSRKTHKFRPVAQAEDCETLITDHKSTEETQLHQTSKQSNLTGLLPLLWPLSIAITLVIGIGIGMAWPRNLDRLCTPRTSEYCKKPDYIDMTFNADEVIAPLMEDVDISYDVVKFSGSLMHANIFRQTGSPEVDVAWESLGIDCKTTVFHTKSN
jgi:hypothetical protein